MTSVVESPSIIPDLQARFGDKILAIQETKDRVPTFWVDRANVQEVLRYLKADVEKSYRMLYDITAIDERFRTQRAAQPKSDFTVVYHLLSFERNSDIRVKVPLEGEYPTLPSIAGLWANANWYEREIYDMFGIKFDGHPFMERLLMPRSWKGHPLRKEHPARATEMGPFQMPDWKQEQELESLKFRPEEWGMKRERGDTDFMFLNVGPQHPGTHGVIRFALQLDGEEIVDIVPEIGFHHRGAEKMGERQSWHTYIPYTDRVDYLGGVMNNLPYLLSVEAMAGIQVPERVKIIRVMMCELFRIASHLVWYGTFAQDIGQMSPVLYMFNDRERIFKIVEAVCGGRMHPSWFRIGGVTNDLPNGWEKLVGDFVTYFRPKLDEYDGMVMQNSIFKGRTKGIGVFNTDEAIEWGITGAGLRATGFEYDFRKARPYSGYENFDFDIPVGKNGDCYDRAAVRVEEMRQSLRIIEQCLKNMPAGSYKSDHPLATPPKKEMTMQDIETLINHFLGVSWGPVIPAGEASVTIEATKGANSYYLISDGNTMSYRTRIRTPSFPHLQMVPKISRGYMISDFLAILGALDFVLADLDR